MSLGNLTDRGTLRGKLKSNTTDYNALINKPAINGHTLVGNKTGHELDLANLEDVINVEANPEGASSGDLNRILIGTNIYEISGAVVYGEASGSIASFDDGGDNKPLKSLKVAINPVQEGRGTPSPQNVRPLHGWTGCELSNLGTDLIIGSLTSNNINTSGEIIARTGSTLYIVPVEQGKSYGIRTDEGQIIGGFFTSMPTRGSVSYNNSRLVQYDLYFTSPINGYFVFRTSAEFQYPACSEQFRYYTIQLGDTCYGGELDVTSGVLRVDRKLVDLGSMTYAKSSIKTDCFASIGNVPEDLPLIPSTTTILKGICSQYKPTSVSAISSEDYAITYRENFSYNGIMVKDSTYHQYYVDNDMQAFQQAMNGVQLVYKLATPQEIQLTPTEVKTLLGTNNFWSDTGDVIECIYERDLNIAINKLIAG